ncbi:MAG TPA: GDP-mannose 4,6-dehydratase [Candidatus Polarisedimenticolaceae bacterium]|nr:GDP-mannose 4,6-dehydratase [Candidatus Polarisedimenticolaceae bacterium]
MTRALVVGGRGQDGTLLLARLRADGCEAEGVDRDDPRWDAGDPDAASRILDALRPDEVYYLAAIHHSAEDRASLGGRTLYAESHRVHVEGLLNLLEAIRLRRSPTRVFYAASSLIFGEPAAAPQSEATPFAPVCIYGITKATGVACCRFYRATAGVHASVGILYTHESPLRSADFVSQRIVRGAVEIKQGRRSQLVLGNLSAVNDWGWAEDTVDAMVRIVRLDEADDFVVATGEAHTVADFVQAVFAHAGLDWKRYVVEDPGLVARRRPPLVGDASRLRARTGWTPTVGFERMAAALYDAAFGEISAATRQTS